MFGVMGLVAAGCGGGTGSTTPVPRLTAVATSTISTTDLSGLVPLPGESGAVPGLQADVLVVLLGIEATSGCDQSLVTDTRLVDREPGRLEEEWLVDRCGVTVPWTVEIVESESGGSDFWVIPSAEVSSLSFLIGSGGWEGMTSQGQRFLLVVEDRAVTQVAVGFEDPTCPGYSPLGIQWFTPKHYLVGNTFAFVERGLYNLTLTGAFRDDDSALGTLRIEPPPDCGAVIEDTWEATPTG